MDKNVFFFRRRYFNANSQEKRITLDCTFSFSFFLLSRPFSPSFFWIHRITRVFVFDQRFAKRKKKKKESQSGSMKRLSFSLSSYFNHFLLLTFFPSMFSFFFFFFTLHSFLAGIIRGGQCSIFQKLLAQNNKYFFVLGARKKSSLVEKRGKFKE